MKPAFRLLLLSLMAAPFLAAAPASAALVNPPAAAIVDANNAFALDLYQQQKNKASNLFFSPYSVSSALAAAYAGARGQTAEEMARTLHFPQPAAAVHQSFAELIRRFANIQESKRVELSVANALWRQRGYHFDPAYLDLNRNYYRAELQEADFSKSEETRQEINTWVERKTNDKIRELLKAGQIDGSTRLLLCSAIYFKGDWATKFDPQGTRPESFFVNSNHNVTVPMMSRRLSLRSHAFPDFRMFALPYAGGDLSMVILLPNAIEGLAGIEAHCNATALKSWLQALNSARETESMVSLPKFKLNCRLDLGHDLAAMGMPSAFGENADFSGMTGKRDLFISSVAHQACVDVNEQGTEAAAATGITMRLTSVSQPVVLRVDRPFLFFIVERQTHSILFLGRVTDPTRSDS